MNKEKTGRCLTCDRLDIESLGSWPAMPKHFPGSGLEGCSSARSKTRGGGAGGPPHHTRPPVHSPGQPTRSREHWSNARVELTQAPGSQVARKTTCGPSISQSDGPNLSPLPKARRPRGARPGPARFRSGSDLHHFATNRRTYVAESRKATPTQCVSHLSVSCNNRYNFRRSFEVVEPWSKPCLTFIITRKQQADPKKSRSARQINQARVWQVNLDLLLFLRGMRLELDRSRHCNFGALWWRSGRQFFRCLIRWFKVSRWCCWAASGLINFVRVSASCRNCTRASGVRLAIFFYIGFQRREVLGAATLVPYVVAERTEFFMLRWWRGVANVVELRSYQFVRVSASCRNCMRASSVRVASFLQ